MPYFRAALKVRPDDEGTQEFIAWCEKGIALPRSHECFRERTKEPWDEFADREAKLHQLLDQGQKDATAGALADTLRQSTVWYFWWD